MDSHCYYLLYLAGYCIETVLDEPSERLKVSKVQSALSVAYSLSTLSVAHCQCFLLHMVNIFGAHSNCCEKLFRL